MACNVPLRVLYLLHDSRRSGVPAVICSLVRCLDPQRVTPEVLFAYDGAYARDLREQGIAVTHFGKRWPLLWRINRFMFNLLLPLHLKSVDVVHVNSCTLAFSALVVSCFRTPIILHLHEKPGRWGLLLKLAARGADCVVFCANNGQQHFSSLRSRKTRVISNAVILPPEPRTRETNGPPRLVMLGSINRNKGQDLLVEALALLTNRKVELHLYGTVGLSARGFFRQLQRRVRELGLEGRVFFPGPTDQAAVVFGQASILVHASLNECMSISVLEALSHGLPVIANNIAGMDEIISDGITGFLVPTGDVNILAQRIDLLLADQELAGRLGQAGREMVVRRFNMQLRASQFMSLYEELVTGRANKEPQEGNS